MNLVIPNGLIFREKEMAYTAQTFANVNDAVAAYQEGKCDAYTADQSQLYAVRLKLAKPEEHIILPEVISKEPLGPVVRHGDDQWFDVVMWTHYAMVTAEELGVTKANVDEMMNSENPEIKRLLGKEGEFGPSIGVGFALEEIPCGGKFFLEHGSRDWPEGAEERCRAADAILLLHLHRHIIHQFNSLPLPRNGN